MQTSKWLPISTAPKDEYILAFGPGHGSRIANYAQWYNAITGSHTEGFLDVPSFDRLPGLTHWQPLPAPPEPIDAVLIAHGKQPLRRGE